MKRNEEGGREEKRKEGGNVPQIKLRDFQPFRSHKKKFFFYKFHFRRFHPLHFSHPHHFLPLSLSLSYFLLLNENVLIVSFFFVEEKKKKNFFSFFIRVSNRRRSTNFHFFFSCFLRRDFPFSYFFILKEQKKKKKENFHHGFSLFFLPLLPPSPPVFSFLRFLKKTFSFYFSRSFFFILNVLYLRIHPFLSFFPAFLSVFFSCWKIFSLSHFHYN